MINNEVTTAVRRFFDSGTIYKAINCTSITLIPKKTNPVIVRMYRPIACCTVLYKIIAKILTARMQGVIASVISESQSGFIPRRKISDNIILATKLVKAYQRKHILARCMIKIDL